MARRNEDLPMVDIVLRIDNCSDCPKVRSERTPRAGFALDYFCNASGAHRGEKTMGYVEYSSDHQAIPHWCPLRSDNKEAHAKYIQGIVDMHGGTGI